jgi:biotin carboxyl carrier protein
VACDFKADPEATAVVKGEIVQMVSLSGVIGAEGRTPVVVDAPGRVRKIFVTRGDGVSAGDRLFEIEARTAAVDLQRKRLAVLRAKLALLRASGGAESNGMTEADLLDLEVRHGELRLAEFEEEEARRFRDGLLVRSPIAGTVVAVNARPGDIATPQTAAVILANTRQLVVDVECDEFECGKVEDQRALVFVDSLSASTAHGRVKEGPVLRRPRSAPGTPAVFGFTVTIEGGLPARAQPGLSARIQSIAHERGRSFVWRRAARGWMRIDVTLGLSDDQVVEVISGLTVGEYILKDSFDSASTDNRWRQEAPR